MSTAETKEVKEPEGLEEDEEDGEEGKKPKKVVPPQEAATVAGALAGLVGSDKYADVRFVLYEGKERVVIPAHRVVLAAASDVFEAMLYPTQFPGGDDSKDSKERKGHDDDGLGGLDGLDDVPPIEIKDVKPSAFRAMLSCIYTDTADFKAEDLPDVIAVANKFQLDSLRAFCVNFMQDGVTPDNACSLFLTSDRLMRDQGGFALQFIEDNTEAVVNSPGWDTLDEKRLRLILSSDNLTIDEIDLFKGCLRWAVSECRRRNIKVNQQTKLEVLKNVIPLIRFPAMSMTEIATFVSPSQVLTADQLLELFTYMGQSSEDKKPEVSFPTKARVGSRDKWTLDPVLKSTSITLSNKDMTATNSGSSHSYCLGTQAWSRGKHAWRVLRESNPTAWLSIGVSHKTTHSDSSYSSATFYGLSSANQRYFAGQASSITSNFTTGPLDVLFDADAGTLSIINLANDTKHSITGIPTTVPLTPHFGPNSNQSITVRSISARDYGRAARQ